MPATGWNGKFRGQGNGGFAGEMDYRSLALAVLQGYASAATDTGHARKMAPMQPGRSATRKNYRFRATAPFTK